MSDNDILSLGEAQAAIGAPNDQTYDGQLERANTAASKALETKIGPVVIRTITGELHQGGGYAIRPYRQPIDTITTVIEARWTSQTTLTVETFGTAPQNGYLYDPTTGEIYRRQGGFPWMFWPGTLNIKVTYDAGRYDDTDSIDDEFKEAAAIVLEHNWKLRHGQGSQTFGGFDGVDGQFGRGFFVPNAALEILGDERRVPGMA